MKKQKLSLEKVRISSFISSISVPAQATIKGQGSLDVCSLYYSECCPPPDDDEPQNDGTVIVTTPEA